MVHPGEQALSTKEDMMEGPRWLLPFTHGVDMQAVDAAVRLAENGLATLIAVSLISVPSKSPARGARLEHIQQSKDFLESVYYKARKYGISLERYEVFTPIVQERLIALSSELHCDAIILLGHNRYPALLHTHEMKLLLTEPPTRLLYIHMAPQTAELPVWHLGARLLAWLRLSTGSRRSIGAKQDTVMPKSASNVTWESLSNEDSVTQRIGGDVHAWSAHLTFRGR